MSDQVKRHGEAATTPFWDKAISAFWLAFLAILIVNLVGNEVMYGYILPPEEHAEMKFGFPIEAAAEDSGAGAGAAAERVSAVPMIAAATVEAGAEVFRKCGACHTAEAGGANKTGPNLHNIVGDAIGDRNGFKTTDSLKGIAGGKWDYVTLEDYVENPKHLAPKGSMSFAGLKKPEDRAAVIKYLMSQTDSPPALPAAP